LELVFEVEVVLLDDLVLKTDLDVDVVSALVDVLV